MVNNRLTKHLVFRFLFLIGPSLWSAWRPLEDYLEKPQVYNTPAPRLQEIT